MDNEELLNKALLALSDGATKDEILGFFNLEVEVALLAAANPTLNSVDIEKLALEIPKEYWGPASYEFNANEVEPNVWKIAGLACNRMPPTG
jgi:hypothetical protein